MLERFKHHTPETPAQELVETLIITANGPKLDHASRQTALAANLLEGAGAAKRIVAIGSEKANHALGEYLGGIDTPKKSLIFQELSEGSAGIAHDLEKIVDNHAFGDVAILSAGGLSKQVTQAIKGAGLKLELIIPEDVIGKRIVESSNNSKQAIVELLKQAFLDIIRVQKLHDIRFTRLARSTA